jgi:hypothetical protein
MRGIVWLAEELLASPELLCFFELVNWILGSEVTWRLVSCADLLMSKSVKMIT